MQVTGGSVAYEDGIKKAEDYAPAKKARVELKFDVAEGEDHTAALNHVSALAIAKTNEMIGLAPTAKTTKTRAAATPASAGNPAAPEAVAPPAAASTPSKTKADLEAELRTAAAPKAAPPAADPMADMIQTAAEPASVGIMDEDFVVEASPEISDADLVSKLNHFSQKVGSVKVRKLVDNFNPDRSKAFSARQIPPAQRPALLEQLEALT